MWDIDRPRGINGKSREKSIEGVNFLPLWDSSSFATAISMRNSNFDTNPTANFLTAPIEIL